MAASDVEICSNALIQIGADPITSLTDSNDGARLANRLYTPMLDELLRSHNWNFATRRAALSRLSAEPAFGYDYQFQLPQDPYCLFVLTTDLLEDEPWEIETYVSGSSSYRVLVTDQSAVNIVYIARITDTTLFDPLFTTALTDRLSFQFAYPLKASRELADLWWRKAEMSLQRAKSRDGQEARKLKKFLSSELTKVR